MGAYVSANDALSLRNEGEIRCYPVSYERAWAVMVTAIRNHAFTMVSTDKGRGEIVVSRVMNENPAVCWVVGIFLVPIRQWDTDGTQIEMGFTRALGICGAAALENPASILYRSFETELKGQVESVETSTR